MPVIGQERLVELRLPSSTNDDPAIVTINTRIAGGQAAQLYDADSQTEATFELIASAIKSWNFTNADGSPAAIDVKNVKALDATDFEYLSKQVVGQIDLAVSAQAVSKDEKKG